MDIPSSSLPLLSSQASSVYGIHQDTSVNTILFVEAINVEDEPQFFIQKKVMLREALKSKGCFNAELLAPIPKIRKEWITLIQFQNESLLRQWLDSQSYTHTVSVIKPYVKSSHKQLLSDFNRQVSHLITTTVPPEKQEQWLQWHNKMYEEMISFPGFIGSEIHPSKIQRKGGNITWVVNFQFENAETLSNWLNSPQRRKLMKEGSELYEASTVTTLASGFGSWFNMKREDGSTVPGWKMALIVEMALYPLLLTQAFLTPFVSQWFVLPIALLINSFYGCFLMQYFLVPKVQKMMNFWLLPKRKQEQKINLVGLVISLLYLLLTAYLSVSILQGFKESAGSFSDQLINPQMSSTLIRAC